MRFHLRIERNVAHVAGTVVELARVSLHVVDKLLVVVDRQRLVDVQHEAVVSQIRHVCEALNRVIRQCLVQGGRNGNRARCRHEQIVAVWLFGRYILGRDDAVGTNLVFDHKWLSEMDSRCARHCPCQKVCS